MRRVLRLLVCAAAILVPRLAFADPGTASTSDLLLQGSVDATVTITGSGLTGATAVSFGRGVTTNSFTVDSDAQIMADVDVAELATCGVRGFTVTTPTETIVGRITVEYPTNRLKPAPAGPATGSGK